MVEGKEGKKMLLWGIKMFSVSNKKLYCHATELVCCQYIDCSEACFSQ